MKQAESDAAVKVHKYERIKSSLMDAESKEMHSKQEHRNCLLIQESHALADAGRVPEDGLTFQSETY